jgi:lysyl-tRNA synthetase class 2
MEMTEEMIAYVCDTVFGTRKLTYDGIELDFNPPWQRVNLRQSLIEKANIDISLYPTAEALEEMMVSLGMKVKTGEARGKLIAQLLEEFVEPTLVQPTFMIDYPRDISPLAKNLPGDPSTVERFEGFVCGMELCNAFTELNDPLEQEKRFLEMGRDYKAGDEEQHPMDEDYLKAMSYGMPPQGGFGMGIDRLVMLLTDQKNIREVLLFPSLRERDDQ